MSRLASAMRDRVAMWSVLLGLSFLPAAGAWAQQCEQIGGSCATIQAGSFNTCDPGFIQTTDSCSPLQGQERVCCLPQTCEARSANAACYAGVYTCPAGTTSLGDGGCTNGSCCAPIAGPSPTPTPNPSPTPPPTSGGNTYRLEFVHTDMLGSVRMVTDATGAVVSRHDYKPFGEEVDAGEGGRDQIDGYLPAGGDPRARERFTGKPRDPSGLDYFGARYYAATQGRFSSVDPIYTWNESLVDPQRWNRYAYVRNNALKYTDPDGRELKLVLYHGGVSEDLATEVGQRVARKYESAGVLNVTVELREKALSMPTAVSSIVANNGHTQLIELRRDAKGWTDVPENEAGHNTLSVSYINVGAVAQKTKGQMLGIALGNVAAHESGHRWLKHSESWTDMMREGGARRLSWLQDTALTFGKNDSALLRQRYNRPGEIQEKDGVR
jgi:RHS repeat-associated protein